ncbi:MAG: DUF4143 domain-containing protein [Sandaracinaceae bacterium]
MREHPGQQSPAFLEFSLNHWHPKLGASWEGVAMQQVVAAIGARADECHFWATHAGAELDLLVVRGNRRRGFEIKRTESPKTRDLVAISAWSSDALPIR